MKGQRKDRGKREVSKRINADKESKRKVGSMTENIEGIVEVSV